MNKEKYIKDVLKNITTDSKTRNRIKEDLLERIEIAQENDPFFDIVSEIGHPSDVANEFNDNLESAHTIGKGIRLSSRLRVYEYKSKKMLFGIPLLHVNIGGRYQNRVAKGIIAVGDASVGVISVGGFSLGLLSFGGFSVGALCVGGLALGGLAVGGLALGGVAIGGMAVGLHAVGGMAIGVYKAIEDQIYYIK